MLKLGVIVQARSGSSRLPKKMLKPFFHAETILDIILNRLVKAFPSLPIVLATTCESADDEIEAIGRALPVTVFRGDRDNVVKRFVDAALHFQFDNIVRVCADNPFINMEFLAELIAFYEKGDYDYASFRTSGGVPAMKTHFGLFAEIVRTDALRSVAESISEPRYLEHVTNYIYEHNDRYKLGFLKIPPELESRNLRLTIDTAEDFSMLAAIYSALGTGGQSPGYTEVISYLDDHAEYYQVMANEIKRNSK